MVKLVPYIPDGAQCVKTDCNPSCRRRANERLVNLVGSAGVWLGETVTTTTTTITASTAESLQLSKVPRTLSPLPPPPTQPTLGELMRGHGLVRIVVGGGGCSGF